MLNILTFNIYHCLQAARHAGNPFFSLLRLENGMRMMSAAQKCLSQAAPANIPGNIGEALAIRMTKLSSISAEVGMIFNRSCVSILMYFFPPGHSFNPEPQPGGRRIQRGGRRPRPVVGGAHRRRGLHPCRGLGRGVHRGV